MAVADLDEAKLTLSMPLAAVAVAKVVRLQDSALQHTQSARPRPSHALQKSPAVNSVAVVVNLDFIVIRCLRRPCSAPSHPPRIAQVRDSLCRTDVGWLYSPEKYLAPCRNKTLLRWFTLVCVSEERLVPASFEELAMPLLDRLYNFAHWLTRNHEEAEDLVQETFAKALKGFSSFRSGTNFRAWIFRILRNTFLTSRTGLKATMTLSLDSKEEPELAGEGDTPGTILMERSNRQLVQSAIDELPVYFREVVLLCDVEEMSYQEIAETLSIPIGTVMSRLSRARRTLRDGLRLQFQKG